MSDKANTPKSASEAAEAYADKRWDFITEAYAKSDCKKDFLAGYSHALANAPEVLQLLEALERLSRPAKSRGNLKGTGDWSFPIDGDDWQTALEALAAWAKAGG